MIVMFKDTTNIYQIDAKKTRGGGERIPCSRLEDLRIKSKFPRSNMTIREVGRSGERKNPRMRRKKRKKTRAGRVDAGLKQDLGAKLGANDLGINGNDVEVSATSTLCLRRCRCHARTLALIGLAPRRVTSGPIITVPSRGYRF